MWRCIKDSRLFAALLWASWPLSNSQLNPRGSHIIEFRFFFLPLWHLCSRALTIESWNNEKKQNQNKTKNLIDSTEWLFSLHGSELPLHWNLLARIHTQITGHYRLVWENVLTCFSRFQSQALPSSSFLNRVGRQEGSASTGACRQAESECIPG